MHTHAWMDAHARTHTHTHTRTYTHIHTHIHTHTHTTCTRNDTHILIQNIKVIHVPEMLMGAGMSDDYQWRGCSEQRAVS